MQILNFNFFFFPRWGLAPPSEEMVVEQRNLSLSSAAVLRVNEFEFHFPKCHEGAANLSTCWLKPNLNPWKTRPKPHWAVLIEEYIIQAKVMVLSMWWRGEIHKKKRSGRSFRVPACILSDTRWNHASCQVWWWIWILYCSWNRNPYVQSTEEKK